MIRMSVGDKNTSKPRRVSRQLVFECRQVARIADARVDENCLAIGSHEQVGVVAAAGHRAGVVRLEKNRRQHHLKTIADAQNDM